MRYRLAILNSHPIQYFVPFYRKLAEHPRIDLTVYYGSRQGAEEYVDTGFGQAIKWDIPLLEGYRHKFLSNWSWKRHLNESLSLINPSIIGELRREKYDAVLVHGYIYFTNWLAFLAARLAGTPILLRGESHLSDYRPGWKRSLKAVVLTKLFRHCAAFLPIGRLNADYYRHYGVPERKLFLAPYSVDNEFFTSQAGLYAAKREELKEELGIAPGLPVILYASKMTPRKRAIDLLRAFERLTREGTRGALVFVGDGEERQRLEAYAAERGLPRVYFLGFRNQSELPRFYAIADVFVLPSVGEPWGLIINEVMCAGVPVVTTDQVGAAPDLVRPGENGFVYPAGDFGELAECLRVIIGDPEQVAAMGRRSHEIISRWDYERCLQGVLRALDSVSVKPPRNGTA